MNDWLNWTTLIANAAAIVTAIVAVAFWWRLRSDINSKRERLEKYLKGKSQELKKKDPKADGAVGAVLIARHTGLTESEIFQISNEKDSHVGRLAHMEDGRGKEVVFYYKENPASADSN